MNHYTHHIISYMPMIYIYIYIYEGDDPPGQLIIAALNTTALHAYMREMTPWSIDHIYIYI